MASVSTVTAAVLDITAYAGDTWQLTLTFTDSDDDTPIDMSAYDLKMQIKTSPTSSTAILTLDNDNGISISGADNNVVTLRADLLLKGKNYVYDFQATATDSTITTYLRGKFIVVQDVTDSNLES